MYTGNIKVKISTNDESTDYKNTDYENKAL